MGIVRSADDKFVFASKNGQPLFTGANVDLAAFCGKEVEVDGLLVGDESITPGLEAKIYQVQTIRVLVLGEDELHKANLWTKKWEERFPNAEGEGPWFRRDPRIEQEIGKHGRLGLGPEADQAFAEENF
jgi:hypothetical protein